MQIKITTPRLLLCPLGLQYLESVYQYSGDIDITKYMIFLPHHNLEETRQFLIEVENEWEKEQPDFYEFAICIEDVQIGAISLYLEEDKSIGEFGWILDSKYQGKGYVTEAAQELMKYANANLGVTKFIAHCDTRNVPSRKVMEKLGMKKVSEGSREYSDERGMAAEYLYEINL